MRPLPATVYRENSLGPAPGQGLVNGLIIFLAICTLLYAGAEILIPVLLAILLSILSPLIHPLTQLGIVVLMLTFFLIYREDLRNRLIRLAGTGDIHRTTTAIDEAGRRLSRLFATQMMINAATGLFIGISLFLLGVPGLLLAQKDRTRQVLGEDRKVTVVTAQAAVGPPDRRRRQYGGGSPRGTRGPAAAAIRLRKGPCTERSGQLAELALSKANIMRKLIAVAVLTVSQFTAFPFVAIMAGNSARQSEVMKAEETNVTVVYKTHDGQSFETL